MSVNLSFEETFEYNTLLAGITVPIKIFDRDAATAFDAKIDTGSSHCIFQRGHAEKLGIEIESGIRKDFSTATGIFSAFEYELSLSVLGITTLSRVFFAAESSFSRNVLGRIGWLTASIWDWSITKENYLLEDIPADSYLS